MNNLNSYGKACKCSHPQQWHDGSTGQCDDCECARFRVSKQDVVSACNPSWHNLAAHGLIEAVQTQQAGWVSYKLTEAGRKQIAALR